MKERNIRVTTNQLDKLLADIRALPHEPLGNHLSDDEFINYSQGTSSTEEMNRIDTHIASCSPCASEMERLIEAFKVWRDDIGKRRLERLRERMYAVAIDAVVEKPKPVVRMAAASKIEKHNDSIDLVPFDLTLIVDGIPFVVSSDTEFKVYLQGTINPGVTHLRLGTDRYPMMKGEKEKDIYEIAGLGAVTIESFLEGQSQTPDAYQATFVRWGADDQE